MEKQLTKQQRYYMKMSKDPEWLKKQAERKREARAKKNPDAIIRRRNSKYTNPEVLIDKVNKKFRKDSYKDKVKTLVLNIKDETTKEKSLLNYINKINNVYKSLFEYNVDPLDLSFLTEHFDRIIEYLEKTYPNDNTRKNYFTAITSITKRLDMPITEKYKEKLMNLKNKLTDITDKNEKTEKEKAEWKPLDEIESDIEHTEFNHIYKAIVSIYVLNPPRRVDDYRDMKIYSKGKKSNKFNYLVISKGKPKYFIFNRFKTIDFFGPQKIPINEELADILEEFIGDKTSGYLFGNNTQPEFSKLVKKSFNIICGYDITANLIRKIYITDFLDKKPSKKEKKEMANMMAHSFDTQTDYEKHK